MESSTQAAVRTFLERLCLRLDQLEAIYDSAFLDPAASEEIRSKMVEAHEILDDCHDLVGGHWRHLTGGPWWHSPRLMRED